MVGVLIVLGMISTTLTYILGLILMIVVGIFFGDRRNGH